MFFCLCIVTNFLTCQILFEGVVLDFETKNPISNVNITSSDYSKGTFSSSSGKFSINIGVKDTLIFSSIGYETLQIIDRDKTVFLRPKPTLLEEVIVTKPNRKKFWKINSFKTKGVNNFTCAGLNQYFIAKKITCKNLKNHQKFIDKVNFFTLSELKKATIKLYLFDIDSIGFPNNIIFDEELIIEVSKGKKITSIDFSKYQIKVPNDGFFVGFEWLITNENLYNYTANIEREGKIIKNQKNQNYQPYLGLIPSDDESVWHFMRGKWYKWEKVEFSNQPKFNNKYKDLAVEVILSN